MSTEAKSFDWRVPAIWIGIFGISLVTRSYVEVADAARRGQVLAYDRVFAVEVASHIVAAALVPVLYWMHRRWPIREGLRNVAIHILGVVPYSLFHTLGMAALRQLWFNAVLGETYSFPLTVERLTYEFAKDVFSYGMLSGGVLGLRYLFARAAQACIALFVQDLSGRLEQRDVGLDFPRCRLLYLHRGVFRGRGMIMETCSR